MSHSEKFFTLSIHHKSKGEFTAEHRSDGESDLLEQTGTAEEFCPAGWDQRIEDYFRSCMIYEEDENRLLEHLLTCKHCAEHIAFLEELHEALGKYDRPRLINKQQ